MRDWWLSSNHLVLVDYNKVKFFTLDAGSGVIRAWFSGRDDDYVVIFNGETQKETKEKFADLHVRLLKNERE